MLFKSLFCIAAFTLGVNAKALPFPSEACTSHDAGGSPVLFCDGDNSIPNRYIIKFKPGATSSEILGHLTATNDSFSNTGCSLGAFASADLPNIAAAKDGAVAQCVDCEYKNHAWAATDAKKPEKCGFNFIYESKFADSPFTAYAAALSSEGLAKVLADPLVEKVSTDRVAQALAFVVPPVKCGERKPAISNLVRISTPEEHISLAPVSRQTSYKYDTSAGYNQNYYVIDTGVRKDHVALPAVQWAGNFVTATEIDDNGHGSHVAGTIRSNPYGISIVGTVVAIKVLNSAGSGTTSQIIAGIQRAFDHFVNGVNNPGARTRANQFSAVINLSLGYTGREPIVEDYLVAVTNEGMTVVVAAGNAASDACLSTPAAGPGVITVGNLDSNDDRSPSSNYGDCIDIWAPGTNILSISAFGANTATAVKTGTSMACPHVVGIVGSLKTRMTFAQTTDYFFVRSRLLSLAHWVTPIGSPDTESRLLAYNGKGTCVVGT